MDNKFSVGDYVKHENKAFRVHELSKGLGHIPDGFLSDGFEDAWWINPKFCELYNGAISAIPVPETT